MKRGLLALVLLLTAALPIYANTHQGKLFPGGDGSLTMIKEFTRAEVVEQPLIAMTCPSGYLAMVTMTVFDEEYSQPISVWVDAGIVPTQDGPSGTARWVFRNAGTATWQKVTIYLLCTMQQLFMPAPAPYLRSSKVNLQNGQMQANQALCDEGDVALGGSSYFPEGNGRVLTSYPTHNPGVDPFNADYGSGRPKGWKSIGACFSSCIFETNAVCGRTDRYANTYPLKAQDAKGVEVKTEKLNIAPNSTYIVIMSCNPDRSAVAGGYFSSDPSNAVLRSFEPVALGTPYRNRAAGIQDAPIGYKATFRNNGSAAAQVGVAVTCVDSPSGRTDVAEFFNTTLSHYFITGYSAEAQGILNGAAGAGWSLTGQSFTGYLPGIGPGNDVCRFYNYGANTHFYTADAGECQWLRSSDPGWTYEGLAFRIQVPSAGTCPSGTIPIYRLYNNRHTVNDANHRFTASQQVYDQMIAAGWRGEGTAMCGVKID